jgi:hypothetical protein
LDLPLTKFRRFFDVLGQLVAEAGLEPATPRL